MLDLLLLCVYIRFEIKGIIYCHHLKSCTGSIDSTRNQTSSSMP